MKRAITGPLFKWFGAKWNASKSYPPPQRDCLIEPFAGSACYSLLHYYKQVIIAEANPQLFELWTWLINHATEADILSIPYDLEVGLDIRETGLSRGQQLLVKMWQRTNNVGDCWTISPWNNKPGQWSLNTRSRIAAEFRAIRHWKVVPCGIDLMRSHGATATWFIDPPYEFNYRYKTILPVT